MNKLSVNYDKTNYIIFGKSCNLEHLKIKIDNNIIHKVAEANVLGIIIDKKLLWEVQIRSIEKKIAMGIGILCHMKKFITKEALILLYNTLIKPYFDYCVEVWGNTNKKLMGKLITLQKKAIRIISGIGSRDHTNQKFKEYKMLKFQDIVDFNRSIFIYKCFNLLQPTLVNERYKKVNNIHHHNTRNYTNIFQINAKNKLKRHCISIEGVSKFNKLPQIIKTAKSLKYFKKLLKNYYINDY